MQGPDGRPVSPEEVRQHWKSVLDDLSNARIYLLDHNAANYLDSLRMDVQGMPWEDRPESGIQGYVRDIELPRELIWVEYADRKLWEDRVARRITTLSEDELGLRHQRGFLFDNRASDKLTVRLFSAMTEKVFFDAPLVLEISKGHDGRPDFGNVNWHLQRTVVAGLMRLASWMRDASAQENIDTHKGHLSYEMVIGFTLFAALATREDDLWSKETESLSASQVKTARRFEKTRMTDTLKSYVTNRIGPTAERHLAEQVARL